MSCGTFFIFLVANPAIAVDCNGTLTSINLSATGRVSITGTIYPDLQGRDVCNLNIPYNATIPTSVCRGWLANLLMAHASGRRVTIQYPNSNNCSSQPVWDNAPTPHAIIVENP